MLNIFLRFQNIKKFVPFFIIIIFFINPFQKLFILFVNFSNFFLTLHILFLFSKFLFNFRNFTFIIAVRIIFCWISMNRSIMKIILTSSPIMILSEHFFKCLWNIFFNIFFLFFYRRLNLLIFISSCISCNLKIAIRSD